MQSDGVGFHSFGESRHFVIACKRHLGLKFQTRAGGMMGIEFEGRAVSVLVRPVSIETAKLDRKTLIFACTEVVICSCKHRHLSMNEHTHGARCLKRCRIYTG